MTPTLATMQTYYSDKFCRDNPDTLFVFGDNTLRTGKGGQAIIRDQPNTLGIATKLLPYQSKDAFFEDDNILHAKYMFSDLVHLLEHIHVYSPYSTIMLPHAGLGTGLSEMPKRAPKLFRKLVKLVYQDNNLPCYHLYALIKD